MKKSDFQCLTLQQQLYNVRFWILRSLYNREITIENALYYESLVINDSNSVVQVAEKLGYLRDD